jgi:hypothetical protein
MRLRLVPAAILVVLALPTSAAHAQPAAIEVTLDQATISTSLGGMLTLETRIANNTGVPSEPLLAHVNVASTDGSYVDLEDWSATVTQPVAALEPNETTTITWELQAVNAGSFHVYVVLLPTEGPLIPSPSARVIVAEQRTLNAGGALPVAIIVPLLLGIGAAAVRIRVRRRTV